MVFLNLCFAPLLVSTAEGKPAAGKGIENFMQIVLSSEYWS